jgi:hypothetical protein
MNSVMQAMTTTARRRRAGFAAMALARGSMLLATATVPAMAAGCTFAPQGEGRVAAVIDARTFRLADGREVRLAGIEPAVPGKSDRTAALGGTCCCPSATLT